MLQMKEQEKSQKKINEMEATRIPDANIKTIVIRMHRKLRGRIWSTWSQWELKEIVSIKKDIVSKKMIEIKNTISEMKNKLEKNQQQVTWSRKLNQGFRAQIKSKQPSRTPKKKRELKILGKWKGHLRQHEV